VRRAGGAQSQSEEGAGVLCHGRCDVCGGVFGDLFDYSGYSGEASLGGGVFGGAWG